MKLRDLSAVSGTRVWMPWWGWRSTENGCSSTWTSTSPTTSMPKRLRLHWSGTAAWLSSSSSAWYMFVCCSSYTCACTYELLAPSSAQLQFYWQGLLAFTKHGLSNSTRDQDRNLELTILLEEKTSHCFGEGRVQPSVARVLVLISDWLISKSNDVMLVTTPNKEIYVENQGSETARNLFMVGLSNYDVELGTTKRGRPLQRYQTWPTFRSTWGRCQGSINVLFSQNKFKTTQQTLISTLYWHSWRH